MVYVGFIVLVHHVLHILLINITSFASDCLLTTLDALPNIVALIGEVIIACELKVRLACYIVWHISARTLAVTLCGT